MSAIEAVIWRAQIRILLSNFLQSLCQALTAAWIVASVAVLVGTVWDISLDSTAWVWGWIGGGTLVALVFAMIQTIVSVPARSSVAAEVDVRFGLKERLGSAWAATRTSSGSIMTKALIDDATRCAETLRVGDRFPISSPRAAWLPLLSALFLAIVVLVPQASDRRVQVAKLAELDGQATQVKAIAEVLKSKLSQQRTHAETMGLKDAEDFLKKLENSLEKLEQKKTVDQKGAMIALNDIKKQIDQRREQLGSSEQMRRALSTMNELPKGPVDEIAKAMRNNEYGKAQEKMLELAERIRGGDLSRSEQEAFGKQVEALHAKLSEAVENLDQAMEQAHQQIEQAQREGRPTDAARIRQQLDQLEAKKSQMLRLQQLADSLDNATGAMGEGELDEAADHLEALADSLGEMQSQMEQLEGLDELLDSLAAGKSQLRCQACSGAGCVQCANQGTGLGVGEESGSSDLGYGRGQGRGESSENDFQTETYDSQVRGDVKKGTSLISGFADGPNRRGVSKEAIKSVILDTLSDQSDPLENQVLPRVERDHAREYFDRLRYEYPR